MLYKVLEKVFGQRVWGGHEYPDQLHSGLPFRVIFLFANPVDIVFSVKRQEYREGTDWIKNHVLHMNAEWADYPSLFLRDVLGLEKLFDAYYQPQRFPLLTMRYETMWRNQDILSAFVGAPIRLPKYVCRARLREPCVEKAYAGLLWKTSIANDAKVWPLCTT